MKLMRNVPKTAPYAIQDQFFLQRPIGKLPAGTFVSIKSLTLTMDGWAVVVSGLVKRGQDEVEMLLPKDYGEYLGDSLPEGYRRSA